MINDPNDINKTESVIEVLRPFLSPIDPNSQPPTGLIKKPTANIPAEFSNCAVELECGKKYGAK